MVFASVHARAVLARRESTHVAPPCETGATPGECHRRISFCRVRSRVSRRPITGRASSRAPRAMADSAGPRRENESSRGRREDPSESDSSMSSCDLSMSASDAFEVRADRVDASERQGARFGSLRTIRRLRLGGLRRRRSRRGLGPAA